MSNLYRGPSIDASCQVSVHLAKRFQRRKIKKNRPIRNKNCLWRPCLLMDRDEMSKFYREPSIDASYQVSVHLAMGFQKRRLKCENDAKCSDGKSSYCLWQGELMMILFVKKCTCDNAIYSLLQDLVPGEIASLASNGIIF